MKIKSFPFYKQPDLKDCGPTCLRIISKFYGKTIPLQQIRNLSETTREGSSLLGLSDAAENLGFRSLGVQIDFNTFVEEVPLPCIVHWNKVHCLMKKARKKKPNYHFLNSSSSFSNFSIYFFWFSHIESGIL
jgi:ATP-binding cassette subfamily B protein